MICKKCKKEYDPSMEFVEDVELLQAMDFFVNIEIFCPDCINFLRDEIDKLIINKDMS